MKLIPRVLKPVVWIGMTFAPLSQAALLPVTGATASSQWPGLPLTKTTDSSGLTGSTADEAVLGLATHDNNGSAGTMWHSDLIPAAGITLTWNLGAPSTLRTIYYWNHNQNGLANRGIQETQILYSTDNGTSYQSLGNFTLLQAAGANGEKPVALDLGAATAGVTQVRFQIVSNYGGNVTGLSEIRFSDLPPVEPAPVLSLTSAEAVVLNGTTTELQWNTERVTATAIQPELGTVAVSGSGEIHPPDHAETVYTLTGQSSGGPVSTALTVRTVAGGRSKFRYVRFTPRKLRDNAAANSIQLAEFFLVDQATVLTPNGATNPGGDNPDGQGPAMAIDQTASTKWLDFNKGSLVLDFGVPVFFDHYGFVTGGDARERDPVRWTLEGSDDGDAWTQVENLTTFDYPMPLNRSTYTPDIPLPGPSLRPLLSATGDSKVVAGEPLTLFWNSEGATSVTLSDGSNNLPISGLSGQLVVQPAANTTYTFTATNAGSRTTTVSLPVTLVTSPVTTIQYAGFDDAGDELSLLGDAAVVSDPTRPLPGPERRLRLTPDQAGKTGAAWFRKRQNLGAGFESTFALHFTTRGASPGADGIAFIVQQQALGTLAMPASEQENGFTTNALNLKFDSYLANAEPSNAFVEVRAGATSLATTDLTLDPAYALPGNADLTDATAQGPPIAVRVVYQPHDLDVYVNGKLAIDSADVDLAALGAIDANGLGYVGFTSRTGSFFEAHDVTRWTLTSGVPAAQLKLLASTVRPAQGQVDLTWSSASGRTYRITASPDLASWATVLASGIPAASGSQTSFTASFTAVQKLFFRVEEE